MVTGENGRSSPRAIREGTADRIFQAFNLTFLALIALSVLYPLLHIVSASFSSPSAVIAGKVWLWPVEPTWKGYRAVFEYGRIWTGFANSLFYTGVGTALNVTVTLTAGYALSRKDMIGRNALMFLFVFTMLFTAGLIPSYLVVRDLGLLNTRWAIIIPSLMSVWNMIIARTFFQVTLPQELLEAAQIDGSSDFRFFLRVALPLSAPLVAVLALYYAVGHWNAYFSALIYLRDPGLFPLQIVLREILIKNEVNESMMIDVQAIVERDGLRQLLKYSLIVVASVPVLLLYPFVQKHFVKGVMIGSLKG